MGRTFSIVRSCPVASIRLLSSGLTVSDTLFSTASQFKAWVEAWGFFSRRQSPAYLDIDMVRFAADCDDLISDSCLWRTLHLHRPPILHADLCEDGAKLFRPIHSVKL